MASDNTDVNVAIGATGSYKSVLSTALNDFGNFWKSASGGGDAKAAASNMENLSTKLGISSKALLGVGAAGAVVAAGTVAVGVSAIKAATSYQELTTQLVTGAGESERNLDMVRRGILNISDATGESATNAAQGMYMIESAGYHGQAGLNVLKVAAEGAKVGNADLQTAANAVTTVMHNYGLSANDAGQAMNFVVSTVANGKMHMDDLTSVMGKVLPTAAQLHVPLAQVGGAMSTMTDAGIPAARAATALNMTMLKLVTPGKAAVTALNEVGLSSTDLGTTLTTKGIMPALQQLTDAVGKKFPAGSAQYLAALSTITGGVRGLTGTLATSGINMPTFISNTQKIAAATQDAGNKVIGWNLVQKDEKTKMDEAKASIQNAKIALGEGLLPMVTAITKAIGDVVRPIAEWIAGHQKVSAIILGSIGVFGALAVAVTVVTAAVTALNVAALPWIAGAMAVAAVAYVIIKNWKEIEKELKPVIKLFKEDILPVLKEIAKFVISNLKSAWDEIVKSFEKVRQTLAPYKKQLEELAKIIGVVLVAAIATLLVPFVFLIGIIVAVITITAKLIGWISEAIAWFVKLGASIVSSVIGAITSAINWFINLQATILKAVSGAQTWLYNTGRDLINGLIHGIEDVAGSVFKSVESIGDKAVKALKGVLKIFSPSQVFADIGQNVGLGFIKGIKSTHDAIAEATGQMGQVSVNGVARGAANINTSGLSSPGSVSNTTNANTTNSQSVTIQNLTIQSPNGATFQSIIASLNQDSLNASKGLTVNAGAI